MRILIFDSGLGGLTVHAEVRKARPDADYTYLADDAVFGVKETLMAPFDRLNGATVWRSSFDFVMVASRS